MNPTAETGEAAARPAPGEPAFAPSTVGDPPGVLAAPDVIAGPPDLERRGRAWLLWSFLLCPCHLPLTLGILAAVAGGTTLGGLLRDHALVAGVIITLTWLVGTGYGLSLIRRADRAGGACPLPNR